MHILLLKAMGERRGREKKGGRNIRKEEERGMNTEPKGVETQSA